MPAYYLEIFVVGLGLILLMAEAFTNRRSKESIAFLAIIGLGVALFLLICATDVSEHSFWGIYKVDKWSLYYKGIALITTILPRQGFNQFIDISYGLVSGPPLG